MDHAFPLLRKAIARRGLGTQAHAAHVVFLCQQWLEARLPALRSTVQVRKFHEGTLHIACLHSIAAQECRGLFPDLEAFLKGECAFEDIKEIRVTRS